MNSDRKFLIESDIIISHFTQENIEAPSDLIKLMQTGICFTTVINAAELLFEAANDHQKEIVLKVLNSFKVLGLNSRYALKIPEYKNQAKTLRDILILMTAKTNNLPIVTYQKSKYSLSDAEIYNPEEIGG